MVGLASTNPSKINISCVFFAVSSSLLDGEMDRKDGGSANG